MLATSRSPCRAEPSPKTPSPREIRGDARWFVWSRFAPPHRGGRRAVPAPPPRVDCDPIAAIGDVDVARVIQGDAFRGGQPRVAASDCGRRRRIPSRPRRVNCYAEGEGVGNVEVARAIQGDATWEVQSGVAARN